MKTPRIPSLSSWSKYNGHAGAKYYRYEYFIAGIGYFNIVKEYAGNISRAGNEIGWQLEITPQISQGYCAGNQWMGSGKTPNECLEHARQYLANNAHKAY